MRVAVVVLVILLAAGSLAFWFRLVPERYQLVAAGDGMLVHRLDTATGEVTGPVLQKGDPWLQGIRYLPIARSDRHE